MLNKTRKHKKYGNYYLCQCGCDKKTKVEVLGHQLTTGNTSSCGCKQKEHISSLGSLRGEKHPAWNHSLTIESRTITHSISGMKTWRKNVLNRDSNICQACGSCEDLTAHHIDAFKSHPEKRLSLSNGITLCQDCHISFHMWAGWNERGNHNRNLFNKWLDEIGH